MKDEPITLIVGDFAEWYDKGMMAFDEGDDIEDNPYEYGSIPASYWKTGWLDASEE